MSGPLAGIRVVEMTGAAPSPFACMMLADMLATRVAEVLHVVRPAAELDGYELIRHSLGVAW